MSSVVILPVTRFRFSGLCFKIFLYYRYYSLVCYLSAVYEFFSVFFGSLALSNIFTLLPIYVLI